ncbi:MAG: hypothetical protein ACM336_19830 [Acidobacteriota bacterium]
MRDLPPDEAVDASALHAAAFSQACQPRLCLVWTLAGLAGVAFIFRAFVVSRFDKIAGNFGDARLVIYLLEHWNRAFQGAEIWLSPPFFYPEKGILGYSVTAFIEALPYCIFRSLSFDPFVSFELMLMSFSFIGFVFTALLLYRFLGVGAWFSLAGGALFAFSNINYVWLLTPHIYHVMIVPAVLYLLAVALGDRQGHPIRSIVCGLAALMLVPLLLFSEFYTGWFFVLFAAGVMIVLSLSRPRLARFTIYRCRRHFRLALLAIILLVLLFIPFVLTYGPAIARGQGRSATEVYSRSLTLRDSINVSSWNVVWGKLLSRSENYRNVDRAYGISPLLLASFTLAFIVMIFRRRILGFTRQDIRYDLAFACAATVVVLFWALSRNSTGRPFHAAF